MKIKYLLMVCFSFAIALGSIHAQKNIQFTKKEKFEISIEAKESLYQLPKLDSRQIRQIPKPIYVEYNKLRQGLSKLSKNRNLKNREVSTLIKQIKKSERNLDKLIKTLPPTMKPCPFTCNDYRESCRSSCRDAKRVFCGCIASAAACKVCCYFKCN